MTSGKREAKDHWGMLVRGYVRPQWRLVWLLAHTLTTIIYGFRALGRKNLPKRGGYLLVANHQSFLDPIVIGMGITDRETFFLGRSTLFGFHRWWDRFLLMLNCIPLDSSKSDVGALRSAVHLARQGAGIVVFPEGSRTFDGTLQEFQPGVALLIKRARVPVVPVAVEGAFDAYSRLDKLPKLLGNRIVVIYGKPIDADDLLRKGARDALRRLAETIESQRLEARKTLLHETRGLFPRQRRGDHRSEILDAQEAPTQAQAAAA